MATTLPANNSVQKADDIISFSLYEVAATAFKAAAISQLPWLKIPIVSNIFDALLGLVMSKFYVFLSQVTTMGIVDLQTDEERSEYGKAEAALRAADLSGDQNAIAIATANFKSTLCKLIEFDGVTS